jgi:hypothetical protein
MRTYTITALFLLFLLPLTNLIAQDSIPEADTQSFSLKLDLKPNSVYRFVAKDSRSIVQEMMESTMRVNIESAITYRLEVEDNTSDGIKIKASFEEIELVSELPQGRSSIDSKSGNSTELSQVLNKPFFITLNAKGKVINNEGLEDLFRSYEDTDGVLLKDFFTKKKVTGFFENSFNIFPIDPINMGDSWNAVHNQNLNDQVDLIFDKTFTLDGLSEDMAWLSVENRVKSPVSEAFAFEIDSTDVKQEGIIEIDRGSGLVLFSDIKQEFQGILKSNGIEVPVKISLESSLKGELIGN